MFAFESILAEPLAWTDGDGYRYADLSLPAQGKTGFTRLAQETTNLDFVNQLADERSLRQRNLLSGSGVAAGDFDGDGLCDLYFCGLDNRNVLYRNLGEWKFEDVTSTTGLECEGQDSTAAAFADIDGDRDLDLLVNALGGGTRVFSNDGHGGFTETTEQSGLGSDMGSMSMALADIDGDGDLDLYIANFRPETHLDQARTRFQGREIDGKPTVTHVNGLPVTLPQYTNRFVVAASGKILELGQVDRLWLNDGRGRFSLVSFTEGKFLDERGNPLAEPPRDWGLAVQMHDFTGDGAPDIYVCNDLFTPDRVWINDGAGTFRALSNLALRSTSTFSMGVDFADINRDGHVDFFVVDMLSPDHQKRHVQLTMSAPVIWPIGMIDNRLQIKRNTLQLNRGDNTFAEISLFGGVEASDWSWGPIFLDVDLDGYEDILVTNGQLRDFQNVDLAMRMDAVRAQGGLTQEEIDTWIRRFPDLSTKNVLFRNNGDLTFDDVGSAWGFDDHGISQGMAVADLDNDGDLDVAVNNLHQVAGLYRNDSVAPRVMVRLKGLAPNTEGVGARITVTGASVTQSQEMICAGRYLSADQVVRTFAAGSPGATLDIEVTWRSGKRSFLSGIAANRIYEIGEQGATDSSPRSTPHAPRPFFEEASHLLNHRHVEPFHEDFMRQPLLPRRLSQLGPGVAWVDVDGDGWDDLLIGSGRGGRLSGYGNRGDSFEPLRQPPFVAPAVRDQTAIIPWPSTGNGASLFVGLSSHEDGLEREAAAVSYDLNAASIDIRLPGQRSSTGPMAMADVDADGDLDLFVGGRSVPGRYPEAADSLIFENRDGKLFEKYRFEKVGLVSGAVFSDLDGDGFSELIMACEWGSIKILKDVGQAGDWTDVTQDWGLAEIKGWWNGVNAGDFDGDGRLDLVASNWGLNHQYHADEQHPVHVYYGDFDGNSTIDIIEAYDDPTQDRELPIASLRSVGLALPYVRQRTPSFEAYSRASVKEIYGEPLDSAEMLEVNQLASMVFLNRGHRFEIRALPVEAQFSPSFGVSVGDLNGDGNEDVFLSQNFFATHPNTPRYDAGRGLWLAGDGAGHFDSVPGQTSGIQVYGEQRGCALGDFDKDGRVDLVVTQNGAATRLFRNRQAPPGLRVRLRGGEGNPNGFGCVIRLKYGNELGPAREIHGGAGYWSHDSSTQVFAKHRQATAIWVRWPGGQVTETVVPSDANEIAIDARGKLVSTE